MAKKTIHLILLFFISTSVSGQDFEQFHSDKHFSFYKKDTSNYTEYVNEFKQAYEYLSNKLNIEKNHRISIKIFKDQKSFIREIFGYYNEHVTSVGMAIPHKSTIYITSFYDTSTGRSFDEYTKVIRHELVHILLPNDYKWLSEGLALFLANQEREILKMPQNSYDILSYLNENVYDENAYGYYFFLAKMLIDKVGLTKYIKFYQSDLDWNIVGYNNAIEFCNEAFLKINSLPDNMH